MMNRSLLSLLLVLLAMGCEPYTGAQTNCWSTRTSGASVSKSGCKFADDLSFENAAR